MKNLAKYFLYACLIVIGAIAWSLIPKCSTEPVVSSNEHLKKEIQKQKAKKDSVKKEIVYRDSIRTKVIYKYRDRKTLDIPCDTLLKLVIADCDTIVKVDSTLISELKAELFIDNLIIHNQDSIIKIDSTQIVGLKKSIRKHKRQKKLIAAGLGALLFISIVK